MIAPQHTEITCQMILAAKAGDELALQLLLLRVSPLLQKQLRGRIPQNLASVLTTEDLLQETFVKAVGNIAALRGDEPAAFVGWIRQIAETQLITAMRRAQQLKQGGNRQQISLATASGSTIVISNLADEVPGPRSRVARGEAIQRLRLGIAALPRDEQRVVELCYAQGMKRAEAGRVINRTEGAVRNLLMRAKQRLRLFMQSPSRWLD